LSSMIQKKKKLKEEEEEIEWKKGVQKAHNVL
jgi:hypothetical protein